MSHSLRAGRVPTMASWIRDGSHRLGHWDALLPSTTPASQAGILHGNNDGIPNFRWWEKKNGPPARGQPSRGRHRDRAPHLQRRGPPQPGRREHQQHLHRRRRARLPGDVHDQGQGARAGPERRLRLVLREPLQLPHDDPASSSPRSIKENIQSRRQARAGIVPHGMHRGFPYPWVRGATNVALRALGTSLVVQEMVRGTPVIYMDYTDYDEIAHHSGPERPESLDALDGVDRELRTLRKAADGRAAPVPLRHPRRPRPEPRGDLPAALRRDPPGRRALAHGRQRLGRGGDRADRGLGPAQHVPGRGLADEGRHRLARPRRVTRRQHQGRRRWAWGRRTREVTREGCSHRRPTGRRAADDEAGRAGRPHRRRRRQPGAHLLQRQQGAAHARGDRGALPGPRRGARQPSGHRRAHGPLGRRTASSASARTASTTSTRSASRARTRWPSTASMPSRRSSASTPSSTSATSPSSASTTPRPHEIAAFEELIGAHGGLGGAQTRPFLLYPADWELDLAPLIGAPMVYQQLRRWMERELGFRFGPAGHAGAAAPATNAPAPPATPATTLPAGG